MINILSSIAPKQNDFQTTQQVWLSDQLIYYLNVTEWRQAENQAYILNLLN